MKSNIRVFLSDPMTGLPGFNYDAFNAEAQRLRAFGYQVENPAENMPPPCKSWEGYMRISIAQLLKCNALALLPGWMESRGAIIERDLAMRLGMEVVPAHAISLPPFSSFQTQ